MRKTIKIYNRMCSKHAGMDVVPDYIVYCLDNSDLLVDKLEEKYRNNIYDPNDKEDKEDEDDETFYYDQRKGDLSHHPLAKLPYFNGGGEVCLFRDGHFRDDPPATPKDIKIVRTYLQYIENKLLMIHDCIGIESET